MTQMSEPVAEFNSAVGTLRRAIARGATEIAKLSYYPTVKRRLDALDSYPYNTRLKATRIVQELEHQLFGECFTYSLDESRVKTVICWTCNHPLPKWQVEFGYTQCESCQIKAERQFELDNQAV